MPYRTECYSSHSTYLETKSVFPSTILININYTQEMKNISEELHYWSSVISTLHHNSHIIIVLTYDGIEMANDELTKACKRIMNIAKVAIPHHTLLKCLPLNLSNTSVNEEVNSLMVLLDETNSKIMDLPPFVSVLGQILYSYLRDNFDSDKITLSQFHVKVAESEKSIVMDAVVTEISSLLKTLADKGLIFYVEHQNVCWIVIRKERLLHEILIKLTEVQHSSNLGVIDKQNLIDLFHGFEINLVMEILVCLEYCLPIEIDLKTQYYFPDFIGFKEPGPISQNNFIIQKMEVISPNQSLSSDYLINLLHELVKKIGPPQLVWNRGIQWNNGMGRTIIVKMEKRFKCLTMISDKTSFKQEIFKNVKETIQDIHQKICPDVGVTSLDSETDIKKCEDLCVQIIHITFHATVQANVC